MERGRQQLDRFLP